MANYYGYDINNALNGICLPSPNQGDSGQTKEQLRNTAFAAMDALGKQWHMGHHEYGSVCRQIDALFADEKPICDYKTAVDEYLEQFRSKLMSENKCRAAAFDEMAKEFCAGMDHISRKISDKLRRFETDPKQSHSFFVSKLALYYAYHDKLKDHQDIFFKGD